MRLWSLHPKYLDARGLIALWREGLLAQAVLRGKTRGYRHHPQLSRFQESRSSAGMIAEYLRAVFEEAVGRGYRFDASKISRSRCSDRIVVTRGQLGYEWNHLREKLAARDPRWGSRWATIDRPSAHPLFRVTAGDVAQWEKRT